MVTRQHTLDTYQLHLDAKENYQRVLAENNLSEGELVPLTADEKVAYPMVSLAFPGAMSIMLAPMEALVDVPLEGVMPMDANPLLVGGFVAVTAGVAWAGRMIRSDWKASRINKVVHAARAKIQDTQTQLLEAVADEVRGQQINVMRIDHAAGLLVTDRGNVMPAVSEEGQFNLLLNGAVMTLGYHPPATPMRSLTGSTIQVAQPVPA